MSAPHAPINPYPLTIRRRRQDDQPLAASAARERWTFEAHYHAWSARRREPLHRIDHATGQPYRLGGTDYELAARVARAAHIAAARAAYAIARTYGPTPLP